MSEQAPYITEKAAMPGSSLYYSGLYEYKATRELLNLLLTLHHEILNCLTVSPDPGVSRIKLQWWHEELQRFINGEPRHPLTTELSQLTNMSTSIQTHLLRYINSVDTIASGRPLPTIEDWKETYLHGLGEIWNCLPAPETPHNSTRLILNRNGGTILTLEVIQNAPQLLQKGYPLVPQDILDTHGLQANELLIAANSQTSSSIFNVLLDTIAIYLRNFETDLNKNHYKPALYHLVLNRIALATCNEIQADGCNLMEHRVALTPLRKLWIAWKTKTFY